jgi:hypothetical protein
LGENIDTTQKKAEALLDASKEIGLEVNQEKTKYMLMSRCKKTDKIISQRQRIGHLKAWQNANIWEQH